MIAHNDSCWLDRKEESESEKWRESGVGQGPTDPERKFLEVPRCNPAS